MEWCSVNGQAAGLRARMVQFIGGEPTLHPSLPALIYLLLHLVGVTKG